MLNLGKLQPKRLIKHELNNEGCRCPMCQRYVKDQTLKITHHIVHDSQSEGYDTSTREYYLKIVRRLLEWDSKTGRKLRYMLPEVCVYESSHPSELISKRRQSGGGKIVVDKAKMHMFEVIRFLLEGFVYHNPAQSKTQRRKKNNFVFGTYSEKYKNECIVVAKYRNNSYNMFTFDQLESLFKSRYKSLRDGLLYLQTIMGAQGDNEIRISVELRSLMEEQKEMYERAKTEARIFLEEIKSTDMDYVHEQDEISYEHNLKSRSPRDYLQYLTLKIILIISRNESQIISNGLFKYVFHQGLYYLWDVRVKELSNCEEFWATAMMKAFEVRLQKRMSMMDDNTEMAKSQTEMKFHSLGKKARDISMWLEESTSMEWEQMKVIRNRLERLQKEKKSLMQSQSFAEGTLPKLVLKTRTVSQISKKA